jgi:alpha-tubulin suppressor-like RCC1 family protein
MQSPLFSGICTAAGSDGAWRAGTVSLRSWGSDQYGQLGNGKKLNQPSPIEFSHPPGVSCMLLASGGTTSYAVSTPGAV